MLTGRAFTTTRSKAAVSSRRRSPPTSQRSCSAGCSRRSCGRSPPRAGGAPLAEVRDAALVLLYRLLFILYAEDRGLLPVDDEKYAAVGLRHRVRSEVAARRDRGAAFSEKATGFWHAIADLCRVIDEGDPACGLPPYNGGLFGPARAPLLRRIALGDAAVADVVDAMAFRETPEGRRYISYRDLSVQQLGSIYERLLEHEVVRGPSGVRVRPAALARKDSGSYYTPESLVRLIIRETVGPKVEEALSTFRRATRRAGGNENAGELESADAASRLLDLRICDPAMGSGHFLVSLVDYLTDRVIEALAEAHEIAPGYESPVAARIGEIRETIPPERERRGLDGCRVPTRRPASHPADGAEALRVRRGQEPDGGGTRQGVPVAPFVHGRRSPRLPRPPPAVRRQPVRGVGAEGDGAGDPRRGTALRERADALGVAAGADHQLVHEHGQGLQVQLD